MRAAAVLSVLATARRTSTLEVVAALTADSLLTRPWDCRDSAPWLSLARSAVLHLGAAMLVRAGLVLAVLAHEWFHLLTASLLRSLAPAGPACARGRPLWTRANCRGNVPLSQWLHALRPFSTLPDSFQPHVTLPPCQHEAGPGCAWHDAAVQLGAWLLSCLCAAALCLMPRLTPGRALRAADADVTLLSAEDSMSWAGVAWDSVQIGAVLCVVGCTASDVLGLAGRGQNSCRAFHCGNFGMILRTTGRDARRAAAGALQVLQQMAAVSSERGGQSGGLGTFLRGAGGRVRGLRVRVTPGKRESLADKLITRFRLRAWLLRLWESLKALFSCGIGKGSALEVGPGAGEQVQVYAGHTRFATSSIPSVGETHPHQWCPGRVVKAWRVHPQTGQVQCRPATAEIFITHNGDFEFWNLYGRDRTHSELGPWLQVALGVRQPAHCDSVMIAGLMDLHRTQGLWAASLRLAYYQAVVVSYEELFSPSTTVPDQLLWTALGRLADSVFQDFVEKTVIALPPGSKLKAAATCNGLSSKRELEEALVDVLRSPEAREAVEKVQGRGVGDAQARLIQDLSLRALEGFVEKAVSNFFENDSFSAAKHFITKAKGSFGMCVCSALEGDQVVLLALNQSVSVGFAPSAGAVLYSSENYSLTVPLPEPFHSKSQSTDASALGATSKSAGSANGDVCRVDYRFDLDEGDGEVLEIVLTGTDASQPSASGLDEEGGRVVAEDEEAVAMPCGTAAADSEPDSAMRLPQLPGMALRLFNMRKRRMLVPDDIVKKKRLVGLAGNPLITMKPPKRGSLDLVAQDLKDVPHVLEAIRQDWQKEGSVNRQAAAALIEMLKAKAKAAAALSSANGTGGSMYPCTRAIDVLVTGVEDSLWVGEQFAADLQNCFPQLRVLPMSANKVIGVMGNARGAISTSGFSIARMVSSLAPKDAIVLAISQSGQTFPTLHATRILQRHCPGRVFVCVGMLDSKMAGAVGQSLDPAAPACARVFHTLSGWRSAEPASVSVAAAHATLTEILLLAAKELRAEADRLSLVPKPMSEELEPEAGRLRAEGTGAKTAQHKGTPQASNGEGPGEQPKLAPPPQRPLGLRLSSKDIADLERMRNAAVMRSIPDITGWDAAGRRVDAQVHRDLRAQGWQWALHIMETPLAWVLSAAYIYGTVIAGWPLFTAIRRGAGTADHTAVAYVCLVLDSTIYMFLPLYMALLLRMLQGRDLLARIGKRTLVIADVPYVHQVLEEFVSKLFALSFWIASIDVHGANPIDHFVHRFTHRVTRGTLIAVGRPDGRLCSQTKCESWVLMALLQARTIVNLRGTGAEAITVGHNPYTNNRLIRQHVTLPSNRPKFLCEKLLGVDDEEPLKLLASRTHAMQSKAGLNTFSALDTDVIGTHLCDEGTVQRARQRGIAMLTHGVQGMGEEDADDPTNRDAVLAGMEVDVQAVLQAQVGLEDFCENRFLSLERLLAFQVMFHRMAALVASLPLLQFDISRSQSRLRIATTAAPISAADLEREWMDSMSDATLYRGYRIMGGTTQGGSSHNRHPRTNSSIHRISDAVHALFQHRQASQTHHGATSMRGEAAFSHHGANLMPAHVSPDAPSFRPHANSFENV